MSGPSHPESRVVIGLTGGIASGKSTVAAAFAEHGFTVVDADRVARDVVEDDAILAALRARFGPSILRPDGSLDRAAVAKVVFEDELARADLEAIVHPQIRQRILRALDAAEEAGHPVLLDAPLLVENGLDALCDLVVFVDASREVRLERASARGWSAEELDRRERAQSPLAVKKSKATATIRNDGSLAEVRAQVRDFVAGLATWTPDRGGG